LLQLARMDEFVPVANTPELGPGDIKEVAAHGRQVGVTNVAQTYYAFDACCPVDGTNLAREGRLKGDLIVCPQDKAAFDIRTGECVTPEGQPGLRRYSIKVEENQVKVGPLIGRAD
jgi:nitrite reductase/ring-hydroxylating ferredoxin subunit